MDPDDTIPSPPPSGCLLLHDETTDRALSLAHLPALAVPPPPSFADFNGFASDALDE